MLFQKRNLLEQRFGRLLVIAEAPRRQCGTRNTIYWQCQCDCGKISEVSTSNLTCGRTFSCGCFNAEKLSKMRFKHGLSQRIEYSCWSAMIKRCYDSSLPEYDNYGGRGITVCDRWVGEHGFENFISDMGERPSKKHTIDRFPNNNGNYEPSNCRWATWKEQSRNKRNNQIFTYNGKTQCLEDWSLELGIGRDCLRTRLGIKKDKRRKYIEAWTIEEAFTTPVGQCIGNNQKRLLR